MVKVFLKGNYSNFLTHLEIQKPKQSSSYVVLNVHGLYGQSGDKGSKSKLLSDKITRNNIANFVQYSSSRDWSIFKDSDKELSKKAFEQKTFLQETQDLTDAINLILDNSTELFEVKSIKLFIVANSLGGTIVCSILRNFPEISKLVLCASGTGASSANKPILSTYPSKDVIIDSAKTYKGNLLFLQGSLDNTVPIFSQNELYDSFTSTKNKRMNIIEGANHNFTSIKGKNKKLAHNLYIETIINFLK